MLPCDQSKFSAIDAILKDDRQIIIRLLRPNDGEALAAFYAQVPDEDYRFYCPHPLTREYALHKAGAADEERFVCVVLEDAGRIGGYAWYRWDAGADKSSFGICIGVKYKGRGAGTLLMKQLIEIARQIGPPVMTLTVQKANPAAVALYQKMGFKIVHEQMRGVMGEGKFPPESEYYMELDLRQPCA